MSTTRANRVPPSIKPFLSLPPELSLLLLTGTLGCNPNWLTSLFIGHTLDPKSSPDPEIGDDVGLQKPAVLLASWMRDFTFWAGEIRRITGLDVTKLTQQGRFAFLDFLNPTTRPDQTENDALQRPERTIKAAISKLSTQSDGGEGRKVLLILDNPDILLATQATTAQKLNKLITELRSVAYSTIISCSADLALVAASDESNNTTRSTPMEIDTATFITQQAHNARLVMSVHELSSGSARDVSGTLRVTRGGDLGLDGVGGREVEVPDKEMLYLVQRDGSVRVFGRGEGGV